VSRKSGVIHTGFLSSKKYLLRTEKFPATKRLRPIGFLLLSAVLPRDLNVPKRPGPIVFLRSCLFSLDSFVESVGRGPAALSCSHPSCQARAWGLHSLFRDP
jgi:hypothetical protein